ncbi:UNVERIFIED_CONTAM: hypothetical protein PYX00_002085 [Menopon gallinae]|uniref:B30.2/SPRY domain-containing protein n=1 Tax=Menopon gallinae TaxID=328185 RepID=A0AAW2IFX4_9NEOP
MEAGGNCYCGKDRNLNICELLCSTCLRWYHESCISYQLGKLVPFMVNYHFVCKNCSPTGLESFKKIQATFPQICITALGNLVQASIKEGKPKTMFNKDKEIIPFIDTYWEGMTTMPRRVTQSWHVTILRALTKETGTLFRQEDTPDGICFGLLNPELTHIKPPYETMGKTGSVKQIDVVPTKGRSKRKLPTDSGGPVKKGRGAGNDAAPKLPAHGYPLEHPHNKDGYRYILAEPDPHAPFRQEFDESPDWAGKPIPPWLYRAVIPSTVLLALHDRAPQIKVSEDRLTCTGDKGYCMLRATHSVMRGTWYWEATVTDIPDGGALRLGWAQEYANLQAPVGYDKFGYSWRSLKGTRFHESHGKHYAETGYGVGDVLGFLIVLPETTGIRYLPQTYKKDRPLVKFKSHLYYEEKDQIGEALKALKPLKGAKIYFYKNGVCQGLAFEDIYQGAYYPAISLYKSTTITVNFGPNFKHPPDMQFRGMNEKSEEAIVEQTLADMLFLTENHGKLKLDL